MSIVYIRAGSRCRVITFNKILGGAEDRGCASFRPACVIDVHERIVIPLLQPVIRSGYPRSFLSTIEDWQGWGIERFRDRLVIVVARTDRCMQKVRLKNIPKIGKLKIHV